MCGAPSIVYASGHIHVVLRRSPARITSPSPSPRRHADGTLPRHFAGSRVEGRHRVERVQNSEVPYIRCLIGRNEKKFDYINRVFKRFRFRSMRVRGQTLPLSLLCITMILRVRRKFFEITTFPNNWYIKHFVDLKKPYGEPVN